jgi:hypothetical protein
MHNAPFLTLARQFGRTLNHCKAPREICTPRQPGEYRSMCHQGQRKLLMSEIELLTIALQGSDKSESDILVVSAGASPGNHIPILNHSHLYDPAPFAIQPEGQRIKILNRVFTDSDAENYSSDKRGADTQGVEVKQSVIFISDIRTMIDEESVWNDMLLQQRWYRTMQPSMCTEMPAGPPRPRPIGPTRRTRSARAPRPHGPARGCR